MRPVGFPGTRPASVRVDADGPRAAVVVNQASGHPVRGRPGRGGAAGRATDPAVGLHRAGGGHRGVLRVSTCDTSAGPSTGRSGAAALDLCAVAEGVLDGYAVVGGSELGSWDYLGGMLICREAGAVITESLGRELVILDHQARRTPVAAGTPELLQTFRAGAADSVVPSGV